MPLNMSTTAKAALTASSSLSAEHFSLLIPAARIPMKVENRKTNSFQAASKKMNGSQRIIIVRTNVDLLFLQN